MTIDQGIVSANWLRVLCLPANTLVPAVADQTVAAIKQIRARPVAEEFLQLGWVFVHSHPHPANPNQLRAVHSQSGYRCSANLSQANNFGGILTPGEVIGPGLTLRVKQRDDIPGNWIWPRLAVGLITIAGGTG